MPPADGSHAFQTTDVIPSWLIAEFGRPGSDGTWGGMTLDDMIHDFGPVEEADEDDCEPVASDYAAMRREYGTWAV